MWRDLDVLRSGSVRITVQPPAGGIPIVVTRVGAPAVVGERGLLGGVRPASAVTGAPSVFLKLDRATVQRLAPAG
jgi:CRP-like cAMP-binding protein